MRQGPTSPADPALERLRQVAERIRRRAAAPRQRPQPVLFRRPVRLRPAPAAPPRHWSDGPEGELQLGLEDGLDERQH